MLNFFPAGDGETLSEIQSGRRDHEYQVSNITPTIPPVFQIRIPDEFEFFHRFGSGLSKLKKYQQKLIQIFKNKVQKFHDKHYMLNIFSPIFKLVLQFNVV